MLTTHPGETGVDPDLLARCIEESFDCATACTSCADACLGEPSAADLVSCIRTNLDCADVCEATGRVLTRQTAFAPELATPLLEACARACRACAAECERHAGHHEHCRVCAEACRRCEQACAKLLAAVA